MNLLAVYGVILLSQNPNGCLKSHNEELFKRLKISEFIAQIQSNTIKSNQKLCDLSNVLSRSCKCNHKWRLFRPVS